jgi:hypothetical protein
MTFAKLSAAQLGSLPPSYPIALGPGQVWVIPAGQYQIAAGGFGGSVQSPLSNSFTGGALSGQYIIQLGPYTDLQVFDSNLLTWRKVEINGSTSVTVSGDAANFRLANTTGVAIAGLIQAGGTGATNGFNTVTASLSAGGSTWNTMVGGAINPTLQIVAAGTLYTQRPMVLAIPPTNQNTPYILPTAVAAITSGIISAVTVTQVGAGLVANPTWTVINAVGDTTGSGASIASTAALQGSGTLTALYTTGNYGTAGLTSVPTWTFTPSSTVTATAICDFTVTSISVAAAGAAYGNAQPVGITTFGQQTTNTAVLITGNTLFDKSVCLPRNLSAQATSTAGGAVGTAGNVLVTTIHDPGRGFQLVPNLFVIPGGTSVAVTTNAQLTALVGGQNDVTILQPL